MYKQPAKPLRIICFLLYIPLTPLAHVLNLYPAHLSFSTYLFSVASHSICIIIIAAGQSLIQAPRYIYYYELSQSYRPFYF